MLNCEHPPIPTFTATIYVGLLDRDTGISLSYSEAREVVQRYVNAAKGTPAGCVSITPTEFIYSEGRECGIVVGLINYPRFPATFAEIRRHAITLAAILMDFCKQYRVTVVFPTETVMLSDERASAQDATDERSGVPSV